MQLVCPALFFFLSWLEQKADIAASDLGLTAHFGDGDSGSE